MTKTQNIGETRICVKIACVKNGQTHLLLGNAWVNGF